MTLDPNRQGPNPPPYLPSTAAHGTVPPRVQPRGAGSRGAPRRIALTTTLALCLVSALAGGSVALATAQGAPTGMPATTAKFPDPTMTSASIVAGTSVVNEVAREAGPAVVAIVTGGNAGVGASGLVPQGAGSGVIVDAGGLILTNHHVVGDNSSVTVFLADGREFSGTVEGVDTLTDLALLSIDASGLTTATLGRFLKRRSRRPGRGHRQPTGRPAWQRHRRHRQRA